MSATITAYQKDVATADKHYKSATMAAAASAKEARIYKYGFFAMVGLVILFSLGFWYKKRKDDDKFSPKSTLRPDPNPTEGSTINAQFA